MRPLLPASLTAALLLSVLAACGSDGAEPSDPLGAPAAVTYPGPLVLARGDGVRPRAGAAGDAVDCKVWGRGYLVAEGIYEHGATARTPAGALENARSERIFGGVQTGLTVAKREADRVLYVAEVDRVIKQAVIVRDGPATKGAGGPGWYVESWARCDYSELPVASTDFPQLQLWTDATGSVAPTTKVQSFPGPEHCSWESMTFLHLGKDDYVRKPQADLADFFAEEYREHVAVPADARATGFSRDGQQLWVAQDRSVAYVGEAEDAEVWPRTVKSLGCA